MLDATERKTLAWCSFIAGVLCLIPGEQIQGPFEWSRRWELMFQLLRRFPEHRAAQIAWTISAICLIHHLWKSRTEAASTPETPTSPEESARTGGA
ncbi:hypothetical protein [Polyangium sp. 6x1]|uniref:hypothetical protein n=1 Tax=Polyangium sp. 6x1 TaxID=3042689 RepID=UPI0024825AF3|nr:hypothetical protein [Polyangium sp. 6x1]MDI1448003.1 hypothetical protein [Polyangium sp. 6x1]